MTPGPATPRPRRKGWLVPSRHTVNRKILWAASVTAAVSVVVKAAAILKESLVARQFGRSDALDAFLIALVLPDFINNLVAGSFNSSFVPSFIQAQAEGGSALQLGRMLSTIISASAVALVALAAVLCLAAPSTLPWMAGNFDAAKLAATRELLFTLAPYLVL